MEENDNLDARQFAVKRVNDKKEKAINNAIE
jgi:hypothetical protein